MVFSSKRNPAYVSIVDGEGNLLGTASMPLITSDAGNQHKGTATPEKVLAGETFESSVSSDVQTGTLTNYAGASPFQVQWIGGFPGQIRIQLPTGYFEENNPEVQVFILDSNYDGSNIAAGKQIFDLPGTFTADADATAADIRAGKIAYVNGVKITGTANF